ncbi:nose resistant to fluoxetine protein 6-like isoform X2 [Cylas formicarius]|uniref:nose resistant to fluoxetine protein 6-like isoform X2 n=1 Tax=Cylas formicarius TaxID=197179 RepID=UPI002958A27A|nr:nose resistant to fluoxetine protein 6-like isoform X2 [Cylas formicarius]
MKSNLLNLLVVALSFSVNEAAFSGNWFDALSENLTVKSALEIYVPTTNSANAKCRNHSLFYAEEFKKLKLWATEMFDATGKMPSGILYGSSHDLGNFDECLEVKVPYNEEEFFGQYCMAKFTVVPPKDVQIVHKGQYYEDNDYEKYFNESMWEKIATYSEDHTKGSRNELYFGFCLPSSCSYEDLQTVLESSALIYNSKNDFRLVVDVNHRSCQINRPVELRRGDVAFIFFLTLSVATVICSSVYDILVKRKPFQSYKLSGIFHEVTLCFSFPRNYEKLTSEGRNSNGLDCLSGMKVYSMLLIIVLHRIMFEFGSPMVNPKYVEKLYTKFETTLLLNGPILVETFFTISGFLATYLMLGQFRKSKRVNLGLFYVHRIVRMSPTYAVVLAFYCTLFIKLGTGPFWQQRVGLEQERCLASWWANLLYINNYVNTDKICMFQSWYVSCDMNFFLFSPVLTWLLWKKPKVGLGALFGLIAASIIVVFAVVYVNNLDAMFMLYIKVLKDPVSHNSFRTMYIPGHMRASSYFVGTLAGYVKFQMEEKNSKIPRHVLNIGWILCAPIMIASLYIGFVFYLLEIPPLWTALYASLYHFVWSVCVAWMIITISRGYGPWIDPILRWKPLVILSRLTYCVYISHGVIQIYTAASIRTPIHASVFNVEYQTAADILLAYILAFVLSMLFEGPLINLEKVLLSRKDESPQIEANVKSTSDIAMT